MLVVKFFLHSEALPYYFVIFLIGFFLGGPYNIISAATAIDLAKQPALKNNKSALSTISSLIEGMGSLGAAILQVILGSINSEYIFYTFTILSLIASILIVPFALKDLKIKLCV